MEIINVLLITSDMDYARAFTKALSEDNSSFIFTILNGEEPETTQDLKKFDLILSDKTLQNHNEYILLREKRGENFEELQDVKALYKYDTAENISKELTLIYTVKTGHKFLTPLLKKSKIILFCSAEGGTGKTSVALGLAQDLTRFHGKKVLYINYEDIESTSKYFEVQEEKSITNFLYYLAKGKKTNGIIDSFTVSDDYGVRTFSSSGGRNQLKLLTVEELSQFLNIIQENGDFDYIFIDNDPSLGEENIWLISACDKICKVDKWGNNTKEDCFKKYLGYLLGDRIFDKMIKIVNFFDKGQRSEVENSDKIFIEYDEDSFSFNEKDHGEEECTEVMIAINIDRDFGFGIKQLSTKLTLNLQ